MLASNREEETTGRQLGPQSQWLSGETILEGPDSSVGLNAIDKEAACFTESSLHLRDAGRG